MPVGLAMLIHLSADATTGSDIEVRSKVNPCNSLPQTKPDRIFGILFSVHSKRYTGRDNPMCIPPVMQLNSRHVKVFEEVGLNEGGGTARVVLAKG